MTSEIARSRQAYAPKWSFGDHLRKARHEADATQRQFAADLGVKHATYAAWESDRVRCPQEVALARRVEVLTGVRATWLLGFDEPGPPPGAGAQRVGTEPTTSATSARDRARYRWSIVDDQQCADDPAQWPEAS